MSKSIMEIQGDTKDAVTRIEEGSSRVARGVEMATNAGGSLDRILSASHSLKAMVDDISHAVTEQTTGAQQIAEATNTIAAVTRESSTAASQAAAAAIGLSKQSERLLQLTDQFSIAT